MQENLSFVDIIGIIGFIWSFISFYIGYRWYRDGADKDALIAKLTAENELLRLEVREISLADGGRRHETLNSLRSIDKLALERANRFYRAAYSFSRSREHAMVAYRILAFAVAAPVLFYFIDSIWIVALIMIPFGEVLGLLLLLPFRFLIIKYFVTSRTEKLHRILDHAGFSFQEVVTLRGWLDQQEWEDDRLKDRLCEMLNARMTGLEGLGANHQGTRAVEAAASSR